MRELKRIWEWETISPSSRRIIEDINRALETFVIVYHVHGAAIEELADQNGHIRLGVGYGKGGTWGGA